MIVPHTLELGPQGGDALSRRTLERLPRQALAEFLAGRRWFGGKGQSPGAVRVAAVIPVLEPGDRAAVVLLEVELADAVQRYQLPLALRPRDSFGAELPRVVLAEVGGGGRRELLVDATEDAAFRRRVGELLRREGGARFSGEDGEWIIEPVSPGAAWDPARSRVGSAEQSNTSIVYDDRAILKLFRRLDAGENPDVEISRFLTTRTDFRSVPALYGVIRLKRGESDATAGMLSGFAPGSTDAWSHALGRVREYLNAPKQAEPANPFADEMKELGGVTRALHEALASHPDDPAFPALPVEDDDFAAWAANTRSSIERALDLLERQLRPGTLRGRTLAIAEATVRRRAAAIARISEVLADARGARDAGRKTRNHGDLHLGQVLRARDGRWLLIDFEGEPTRPLEERRAPNSPLRDVAGMLRSFAYAASTGAMEVGGLGHDPVVETRAARWERAARASFLDGYLDAAPKPTTPVPVRDRDYVNGVVTLFEIEKVFYELAYELDNRPDWVWIPLRGIAKLF